MSDWNTLDFIIFLIFVANTLLGFSRGATKEILSIIGVSVAIIFCIKFTVPLTQFLNNSPLIQDVLTSRFIQNFMSQLGTGPLTAKTLQQLSYSIALLLCFSSAFFICEVTLNMAGFVEAFPFPYAMLNRKLGGSLGCLRGYVFNLLIVIILALHIFKPVGGDNIASRSFFVNLLGGAAQRLDDLIAKQQVDRYKEIYKDKDLYNEKDIYKIIS